MLHISAASTTTSIAAATSVAIPNAASGSRPRMVLLTTDAVVGFRPIQTGETPALSTMARLRPERPLVVNVEGFGGIRFEAPTGTPNVTVTPLENQ